MVNTQEKPRVGRPVGAHARSQRAAHLHAAVAAVAIAAAAALAAGCALQGAPAGPAPSAPSATPRAGAPAAVTSGYAAVNGLSMYYEIHGSRRGTEPSLVLLHGGGSTITTSFGELIEPLARTRQVIAFEQQGHGHTADLVDRPFSFEQSADDTAALLRELKVERADLFGYSNGGHIALTVAIRHPELVRRLVVESAMVARDGCDPQFWAGFDHASLDNMPAELKEAYRSVAPHPGQLQLLHDKCVKRMVEFRDWPRAEIHSIAAPTLIVTGDHDIVRPEHAVDLYRLLPHARLAILPGTDHMTMVKRADWLVPMVTGFLDAPAE